MPVVAEKLDMATVAEKHRALGYLGCILGRCLAPRLLVRYSYATGNDRGVDSINIGFNFSLHIFVHQIY